MPHGVVARTSDDRTVGSWLRIITVEPRTIEPLNKKANHFFMHAPTTNENDSDNAVAEVVRLQTHVQRHPNSDEFGYDLFDAEIIVGTSLLERSLP